MRSPDVLAERPPEGVLARHDEEAGRLVGAGEGEVGVPRGTLEGDQRVRGRDAARVAVIHDNKTL